MRKILESLVRRQSIAQSTAQRARVILAAAEGLNHQSIAGRLGVFREMAGDLQRRADGVYPRALLRGP